jgi:NAD(P)-dependent dehydrogenase (short-subunit alcohol dehydrogenase family)
MDLELSGKVALISGGSRGIGKAVAWEFAREGMDVVICSRSREPLEAAAHDIAQDTGQRIIPMTADTTDQRSVAQLVASTLEALGRIDVLVNNAATPGGLVRGTLSDAAEEDLLDDINTKVVGYFRCAKAVAPHMQRQNWGRIINIGGLSGRRSGVISGLRNAAIVHLTKTLADQLGQDGITVNLVHPGTTRTERSGPMYAERAQREGVTVEEVEHSVSQNNAIRRIVDAQEIGHVVAFLCSPKAGSITGVAIDASGGSIPVVFP